MSAVAARLGFWRRSRTPAERLFQGTLIVLLHTPLLALPFFEPRWRDAAAFVTLYFLNAFSLTVAVHRYFAHGAFKTSRWFQCVLAWSAGAFFGDVVFFAGKHRIHHKYSDTDVDPHSPRRGFWYAWFGNLIDDGWSDRDKLAAAPDLMKCPELAWQHRWWGLLGIAFAAAVWAVGGWGMIVWAYSPVLVIRMHLMSGINYFCHQEGGDGRTDRSVNYLPLVVLLLGEGWHQNHHRYPDSARLGLMRGQIDPGYYILKALERVGVVWDLREPHLHP